MRAESVEEDTLGRILKILRGLHKEDALTIAKAALGLDKHRTIEKPEGDGGEVALRIMQ